MSLKGQRYYLQAMNAVSPKPVSRKVAKPKSMGVTSMTVGNSAAKANLRTLSFGSATLTTGRLDEAELARNIDLSQAAMKKLMARLVRPGVKLRVSQSTPLFHADPTNPKQLIRTLNGKRERGVFEGGAFKVLG